MDSRLAPNYCPPSAQVAEQWIQQPKLRIERCPEVVSHWWTVFNDPKLNQLVEYTYCQNLTLKQAGCRILQARANLAIARGEMFPQSQYASGSYQRLATPLDPALADSANFSNQWNAGFALRWELDFWGRFRRAVTAACADLDASVADYDGVIVTLLGDVAHELHPGPRRPKSASDCCNSTSIMCRWRFGNVRKNGQESTRKLAKNWRAEASSPRPTPTSPKARCRPPAQR